MKHSLDLALLGLTAVGFGASLFVGTAIVTRAGARASGVRTVGFSGGEYVAPVALIAPPAGRPWHRPEFPRGRGKWIFDLFTPPLVRRDPHQGAIVTELPRFEVTATPVAHARLPLELVAVRPRPYRFRLAGFAGSAERPVVTLENTATGETLLLRSGAIDPVHGLEARRLEVRRTRALAAGAAEPGGEVATAVLFDRRENREIVLQSAGPAPDGGLVGVFRHSEDGTLDERSAGETLSLAGTVYTVERLALDPPSAELVGPEPGSGRNILHVAGTAPPNWSAVPDRILVAPPNAAESSDEPRASRAPPLRAGPDGGDP
jgi:hypothetical protein